MTQYFKNLLLGLFLVGGIALFVWLVLFLRPSVGDEQQTIYVRFSNIDKINIGTRVLFAGSAVGEVISINPIPHARETQPSDSLGRLYFYQLKLKIDSHIHIYTTDEICLQTSGLLGERSIAIIPKSPPKGVIPELITDKTPFYADSIDPIENTFTRISDIGKKLEEMVDLLQDWLKDNKENLSRAVRNFAGAMGGIDKIIGTISQGKGTVGKLIEQDDLYLRLTAILGKVDTTMNDVNHYGLLFHLNKGWQRQRTKRLNLLNALSTPAECMRYFETEIDQINTSMARLSLLVDRAKTSRERGQILENPQYQRNFTELKRQVDELGETLKLYNEQLAEALKD